MATETWLRAKTWWHPEGNLKAIKKADSDYQVTTEIDGIPISEIKGWIKDTHRRVVSGFYWYASEIPPTKRSRPRKDVERYTTKINIGCWKGKVETTIVKTEKEIPDPQGRLF